MTFIAVALVQVVCALIQRAPSPATRRWALLQLWAGGIATALVVIAIACVADRGWSTTGAAVLAVCFVWSGLVLASLVERPFGSAVVERERVWTVARPRVRRRTVRAHALLLLWCLISPLVALWPLRYAGAFVNDRFGADLSRAVTLGLVTPLRERRTIEVGQCVEVRVPSETNVVVPCATPHHALVIAAVVHPETCPTEDDLSVDASRFRVEATASFDGVRYCVLNSNRPERWRGSFPGPAMPSTT